MRTLVLRRSGRAAPNAGEAADRSGRGREAGYGSVLGLAAVLSLALLLVLIAVGLLLVPPDNAHLSALARKLVNQQNQSVKTAVYVLAFFVVLPAAVIVVPRLADRVAWRAGESGLSALVCVLIAALMLAVICVRLSAAVGWGGGLGVLLGIMLLWWAGSIACLWRACRPPRSAALERIGAHRRRWALAAAVLAFGALVCVTSRRSLGIVPLALGAAVSLAVVIAVERLRPPRHRRGGWVFDLAILVILGLAIPDTVVFANSPAIPSVYFDPGVVQFQHDWILGSTNQLLGGGALLVNVPVSQYGVGLIYFLAGWFHLAPIGYGTFGFLDGILTALFYGTAYVVLRLAGVRRVLAGAALVLGLLTFVDNFQFFVGQLPEEGPLRFGLPMLVVLGGVIAAREADRPRRALAGWGLAAAGLGVSAIWAIEALAYTSLTFLAVVAAHTWLAPPERRRRVLGRALGGGLAACLAVHLGLALATLAGTGELPHWSQYLGYADAFLFGDAGSINYGFATFSPGLAVYAGAFVAAAALLLLVLRVPAIARRDPRRFVALAGSTAYAVGTLSYTDNRSSTYLFLYVAVPLLMTAVLWISLIRDPAVGSSRSMQRGALVAALAVAVLLFAGAWPSIGDHLSRSVLAHAYPGGGLRTRLARLWHPPPIDPRAPAGVRLLARYMPHQRHVLVVLPTTSDLGLEILMRSRRANALPVGDPKADSLVPSVWQPVMRDAVPTLASGQRVLLDREALRTMLALRNPAIDPATTRLDGGQPELQWVLHQIDRRFVLRVIATDPTGLIVAELAPRSAT